MSIEYSPLLAQDQQDYAASERSHQTTRSSNPGGHHNKSSLRSLSENRFWAFCHKCADTDAEEARNDSATFKGKIAKTSCEVVLMGAFVYGFDWLIHVPFCDFLYKCGCTYIFDGGWDDCNVHNTSGAPKCPWCMASASVAWTTSYLVQAVMFGTYLALLRNRNAAQTQMQIHRAAAATATATAAAAAMSADGSDRYSECIEGKGSESESPEELVATFFHSNLRHWSNCWTGLNGQKHPVFQGILRFLVAPTFMYFLTGTLVGLLFFLFNPHYHVFIFDYS